MGRVAKPVLMKKGAEANLYLADWHGRKAVIKKRLAKDYRPTQLDEQIRTYRTVHEPQLISEAKKAGVFAPAIFLVSVKDATIVMEHIEGKQLKQLLAEVNGATRHRLCFEMGALIGRLHRRGIVHGDLTTSNMILGSDGRIFLVDFGLGGKTTGLEDRGVDLHLMKRALQSVHFSFADECFKSVVDGYSTIVDTANVRNVLDKIKEIEKRGRYVAERVSRDD